MNIIAILPQLGQKFLQNQNVKNKTIAKVETAPVNVALMPTNLAMPTNVSLNSTTAQPQPEPEYAAMSANAIVGDPLSETIINL